ncbi:MAG: fumarylacetoacetate hydrolase family protein [Kofleriaceae bacterium]|jgi:2-keto-4-pentenoate hydratase/2-oxohepta-3-ene-1,7-dioic acid hydratase in catechol pathway|nr:fumarylacetoacetate hydrolase family protein [Kofleriaceae bacterium]MBP9205237.1 fumarylacetoacetate hydrolase family protein [Kofleriaceae bacterium]
MRLRLCMNTADPGRMIDLRPSKIIGIGQNYRAHAAEMGKPLPREPLMFLKPPSALIGDGEAIARPAGYARVDHEGELGVVIGERCVHVPVARALDMVMGFTCVNDVSVRELQQQDGQWTRAKGFDTFCPLGPRIVSGLDPHDLRVVTRVGGVVRQDSSTSDLIFDVATLIAFVSAHMTLEPGDVISTGTPAGVGNLAVGDVVEVEISGIGVLRNPVVARDVPPS